MDRHPAGTDLFHSRAGVTDPVGLALVLAAGALGGMARWLLVAWGDGRWGSEFPRATVLVNLSGALAAGLLAGVSALLPGGFDGRIWQTAVLGFLGSYTTVSAFSLQTLVLLQAGQAGAAGRLALVSLAGCLSAVAAGLALGMALARALGAGP